MRALRALQKVPSEAAKGIQKPVEKMPSREKGVWVQMQIAPTQDWSLIVEHSHVSDRAGVPFAASCSYGSHSASVSDGNNLNSNTGMAIDQWNELAVSRQIREMKYLRLTSLRTFFTAYPSLLSYSESKVKEIRTLKLLLVQWQPLWDTERVSIYLVFPLRELATAAAPTTLNEYGWFRCRTTSLDLI